MTEKDQKFVEYWNGVVKRGRLKYALLHGFLFGFTIFLFTFIYVFCFEDELDEMYKVPHVFVTFLGYWLGGIIFEGVYTWWMNTKRYKRLTSNPN